jgi:hypothetical protein
MNFAEQEVDLFGEEGALSWSQNDSIVIDVYML